MLFSRLCGRWSRSVMFLSLIVVLAGLPALPTASAFQDDDGKVLRIHQPTYPALLDPHLASFTDEIAAVALNYEGLTRLGEGGAIEPGAAETWAFNNDGTEVTFTLRDGLTYSDGSPLTADRFVDAAQRTCDPNTGSYYQYILFDIVGCAEFASLYAEGDGATPVSADDSTAYDASREGVGISAPDDHTVVVSLNQPAPYFLSIASLWIFYPIQQEVVEAGGENWWSDPANHIGNGPFQLSRIEEDQLITYEANENYWGGRPLLDGVELVYVPDAAVALEAYNAGDLHIMQPDPAQYPMVQSDPTLSEEFLSFPGSNTMMLQFNMTVPPFDDIKVREAFAYAFDRETWCNDVLNGDCLPTNSWIPEGVPGYLDTDAYAFDPDAAVQALTESAYGGATNLPPIELAYVSDNPEERTRAEWIAGHYRDVLGVEISLVPMEGGAWVEAVSDPDLNPPLTLIGWIQDYPDPQNWLSILWVCDTISAGPTGYCNPEFDALVQEADQTLDESVRTPLYEQAHQILLDDAFAVVVFNGANAFLVKPEVTGYTTTPSDDQWPGQWVSPLTLDLDTAD